MAKGELLDSFDHPITFVILMTVAVVSLAAIFVWLFKAAGMPGPAALFQHP